MSFNNHLAFNISKSSATTSTTSATSVSGERSASIDTNSSCTSNNSNPNSRPGSKSQLIHGMLPRTASGSSSPKIIGSAPVSHAAPTVVTYGNEATPKSPESNTNKPDLIGLFGKFDVSDKEISKDEEDDLERKFDRFMPPKPDPEEKEVITEKHVDNELGVNEFGGNDADTDVDHSTDTIVEKVQDQWEDSPQESSKQSPEASSQDPVTKSDPIEEFPIKDDPVQETVREITQESPEERSQENSIDPIQLPLIEDNNLIDMSDSEDSKVPQEQPKTEPKEAEQETNGEAEEPEEEPKDDLQDVQDDQEVPKTSPSNANETTSEAQDFIDEIEEDSNSAVERYQLTEEEIKDHNDPQASPVRPELWNRTRSISQPTVNPAAQYQQSHKPFNFHVFLSQLKMKSADPISRYIKSFLVSFNKQALGFTLQQKAKVVRDFKLFMADKFTLYEPFASMDATALENAREGLEKLLMNRIYVHCFPPDIVKQSSNPTGLIARDVEDDLSFDKQLEKFSWVNGGHLEVDVEKFVSFRAKRNGQEYNFMATAVKELNKVNTYRAPRDKVICILEACKNIFWYLKVNKQETNADEFIPILIFVIIKAKVDHLISNIHYIEHFRGSEWLDRGETSYYLSSIEGAVTFIQNLSFEDLNITQEEYDAHIEAWEANERIRREQTASQTISIQQPLAQHPNNGLSPSNVLMTSAGMFAKSLTNFLSPSPNNSPEGTPHPSPRPGQQPGQQSSQQPAQTNEPDPELLKTTYAQLKEIFPDLDKSIMKDIIYMNKGDLDLSLDACLQLVNDT